MHETRPHLSYCLLPKNMVAMIDCMHTKNMAQFYKAHILLKTQHPHTAQHPHTVQTQYIDAQHENISFEDERV